MKGDTPRLRQRSDLTLQDMGILHNMGMDMGMEKEMTTKPATHAQHHEETATLTSNHHHTIDHTGPTGAMKSTHLETSILKGNFNTGVPGSGWARTNQPDGSRALAYKDLRYFSEQKDQRQAEREILVRLGGNMERYIWTLNGKKYEDSEPLRLEYGERVRLTFINDTMMAHPMHLHGMFVQLENGQPLSKLPNKHTIIIAPGDRYSALLTANEAGEWALHCHLLYHMMAGMMTKIVVATLEEGKVRADFGPAPTITEPPVNQQLKMAAPAEQVQPALEEAHHGY